MRLPPMAIIAHRGASSLAPESTRAALRAASRAQADLIELDVQLTGDGRAVIFHDDRLERTTTGQGAITRSCYRQLRRLDAGSWFAPRFGGERILLLSQALRAVPPRCGFNLELKRTSRPPLLITRLINTVRWTRTMARVLVSSFDLGLLRRCRRAWPALARAVLCTREPQRALRAATALECLAVHPHASLVTRALVREAHARGLRVHTWTVDSVADARRLARLGVDGVITNHPARLRSLR